MKFASCNSGASFGLSRSCKTAFFGLLAIMLTGCSDHKKRVLDYMPQMADGPAIKAQRLGPFGVAMRVPPEGTLSQTRLTPPYHYAADPEAAGRDLKNPLARTKEVLAQGQHLYETYCIVCHGDKGLGNGPVIPKFPPPPTLHSEKVRGWPDGRLFHVMTIGQNLMPSYASQVDAAERWAIIHYVRALQSAQLEKAK